MAHLVRHNITMNVSPDSAIKFNAYLAMTEKVKLLTDENTDADVVIDKIVFKRATKYAPRAWSFQGTLKIRKFFDNPTYAHEDETWGKWGDTAKWGWICTETWRYVCDISDADIDEHVYGLLQSPS